MIQRDLLNQWEVFCAFLVARVQPVWVRMSNFLVSFSRKSEHYFIFLLSMLLLILVFVLLLPGREEDQLYKLDHWG